mmetsp:Transcript_9828/g.15113  ORF Transcript_9828/g.15113 Transcript_9828/m.15113 type:complete len:356 (+) Transcript_9828:103-1170(+)|eukprot:CAMPEP_0195292658 /NCGR_PEP_ID=MMETSP0707-20130614/10442_1 /TAXON_ID=33640 /ORGANISM="Asterionellopsis glacialis, Strain CCMP134" /LENGTH=355 /DNA_ID=CAMNT_0040353179 /DNA_START=34 /DNA_END=1101 /DNA_ORIENTATION=+
MTFNQLSADGLQPENSYVEAQRNGYLMESGFMATGVPSFVPNHLQNPYSSTAFEMMRRSHDTDLRRIAECTHRNNIVRSIMDQRHQMSAIFPPIMSPAPIAMMPPTSMGPPLVHDFAAAAGIAGGLSDQRTLQGAAPNQPAAASLTSTPDAVLSTPDAATSMSANNKETKDKKRNIEEVRYSSDFPRNARESEIAQAEMLAITKANRLVDELERQAEEKKLSFSVTTNKLSATKHLKKHTRLNSNVPSGTVFEPRHCDVLLGRGTSIDKHPGNKYFRRLLSENRTDYVTAPKKMRKFLIATSVVQQIHALGGQFLQQDNDTGLWHPVDDGVAREKASRGLRRDSRRPDAKCTKAA